MWGFYRQAEPAIMVRTASHCFQVKRSSVVSLWARSDHVMIRTKGDNIHVWCGEGETPKILMDYLVLLFFGDAVAAHKPKSFSPATFLSTKSDQ